MLKSRRSRAVYVGTASERSSACGGGLDEKAEEHALASVAICDPATGSLMPLGNMVFPRYRASATVLSDGQVLIAGGADARYGSPSLQTAEVYDPVRRQFERVGDMKQRRVWHTATLLNNGRVLIAGGSPGPRGEFNSAELYDPITRSFTPTGDMKEGRTGAQAELLHDGNVLICDGQAGLHMGIMPYEVSGCELYKPALGTFTYIEDKSKLPPQ